MTGMSYICDESPKRGICQPTRYPQCVFKVKNERIAIIPVFISSFDEPLMVVVEIGSGLIKNKKANINKVVTMYPKSNLEDYLEKMNSTDILYRAKKETTGT